MVNLSRQTISLELTEREANVLLNMFLSFIESLTDIDLSRETPEARQTIKDQVGLPLILYDKIIKVFPNVADSDWVKPFMVNEKRYRDFIKDR